MIYGQNPERNGNWTKFTLSEGISLVPRPLIER